MNDEDPIGKEKPKEEVVRTGPDVGQIVGTGVLGIAFAIIYAFGILRFSQALAIQFGRWVPLVFVVFAVVIAISFIDAVSRLIIHSRKPKDDEKA